MDILSFIFVGLCVSLLLYCALPRTRRWMNSTTCDCGYDVESLTGNDPHGPGLSGMLVCPECGNLLTLRQVRVRGEMEVKYAPRGLSLVVVGCAWLLLAFITVTSLKQHMPKMTTLSLSIVTEHALATRQATITWVVEQKWTSSGDVRRNDIVATVAPSTGQSFIVQLATEDFDVTRGWRQMHLRNAAGETATIPTIDMPESLINWLGKATDMKERADGFMLAQAFRDGFEGLSEGSRPWNYYTRTDRLRSSEQDAQSTTNYRWYVYPLCIGVAGLWLIGFICTMRHILRRPTYTMTYVSL